MAELLAAFTAASESSLGEDFHGELVEGVEGLGPFGVFRFGFGFFALRSEHVL